MIKPDGKLVNPEARLESTSICNANCKTCPREYFTRAKITMGTLQYAKLINQIHELGATTVSVFGYGEPLCDEDISWKIGYASTLGLETFITTNAGLLNTEMTYSLLSQKLSHIRFSAHGVYGNYEKVHRGLNFMTVSRNIFNFLAINDKVFDHACKVGVTVIPMNNEPIDKIRKFWEIEGIDYLDIWKPHNWGTTLKFRHKTPKRLKSCGRPFHGPIQIQSDGKMITCCFDINGELMLGCTNSNTIEEILNGQRLKEIQERHMAGNLKGLICENCDQLFVGENPLLFSSRDPERRINRTSSINFDIEVL